MTCFLSSSCRWVSVLIILHFPSRVFFFCPSHPCTLSQKSDLKNGIIWAPLFSTSNWLLLMEVTGEKMEEQLGESYQYFCLYLPLLGHVFYISYVEVTYPMWRFLFSCYNFFWVPVTFFPPLPLQVSVDNSFLLLLVPGCFTISC